MARYYLMRAVEAVVGGQRRRLWAGTTVADSSANAQAGDAVCPGLCAIPTRIMTPLDAAAVAALIAAGETGAQIGVGLVAPPTGADSIR